MVNDEAERRIKAKWRAMKDVLDERSQRLWVATEARALGHGGIMAVHRATGVARVTIGNGLRELGSPIAAEQMKGRAVRRAGAGRKRVIDKDPALLTALQSLLEPVTRGHPESPLLWTCKSLKTLSAELKAQGHPASPNTIGRALVHELGYSLQGNRKTHEGDSHEDRDAQFHYINAQVTAALRRQQPCISVDTKKKELIGNFKNAGREWHPRFTAPEVLAHDFITDADGKAVPYGVYDMGLNEGWVSVGIDHDTAQFSVESIRRWHDRLGNKAYPDANDLLITADCGGSNGYRLRLWKTELQSLANETGLAIHVHHFPPGTSKWNKIEHRMFCQISRNWRGRPLDSLSTIISLIAATRTSTGLRVHAEADTNAYPKGVKVSKKDMKNVNIQPHDFHGEWNYTIRPNS